MVERRGCVLGRRACVQGALLWGGNGENCDAVAPACCSFFFLFFFFCDDALSDASLDSVLRHKGNVYQPPHTYGM